MTEASVPDAYGYMGMGMAFLSSAGLVFINDYLNMAGPPHVAIGLCAMGIVCYLGGRAYEKEVIEEEIGRD